MTREDVVAKVKSLGLSKGSYVVFGSGPMAVAGLRETNDIDLLVSTEVLERLKNSGWRRISKGKHDKPLVYDVFEAHDKWDFSSYKPTLKDLLKTAVEVDGVPFAAIEEVRRWKAASGRPKDLADIKLLDRYLKT